VQDRLLTTSPIGHRIRDELTDHQRSEALRQLKLSKIHLTPRLLDLCPRRITGQFPSPWAPVEMLAQRLHPLPASLVQFLAHTPRGHILLTYRPSHYEPGGCSLRGRELEAVALIALADLIEAPLRAFQMIGHLLDHLLGCQGIPQGKWLSDGQGFNPPWMEIARQIPRLFALGYAVDEIAATTPRCYFARSIAWYIQDRRRLNTADPLIEKLLRRTLFDEGFCRRALLQGHR